jgi:hypothetical protein
MTENYLAELLGFLQKLQGVKIHYRLEHYRDEALMVLIAVPGQRWEVEFLEDGSVEVERFLSAGKIEAGEALDELFSKFSD